LLLALLAAAAVDVATSADHATLLSGDCVPALSPGRAEAVLRDTDTFCDVYVGFAGSISTPACAFATLNRRGDAVAIFRRLLRDAKRPGQLYALCGLYLNARPEFARAIVPYRQARDTVKTYGGCILSRAEVRQIAEAIEDGSNPQALRSLQERLDRPAGGR
jgi:hypothetical protein